MYFFLPSCRTHQFCTINLKAAILRRNSPRWQSNFEPKKKKLPSKAIQHNSQLIPHSASGGPEMERSHHDHCSTANGPQKQPNVQIMSRTFASTPPHRQRKMPWLADGQCGAGHLEGWQRWGTLCYKLDATVLCTISRSWFAVAPFKPEPLLAGSTDRPIVLRAMQQTFGFVERVLFSRGVAKFASSAFRAFRWISRICAVFVDRNEDRTRSIGRKLMICVFPLFETGLIFILRIIVVFSKERSLSRSLFICIFPREVQLYKLGS